MKTLVTSATLAVSLLCATPQGQRAGIRAHAEKVDFQPGSGRPAPRESNFWGNRHDSTDHRGWGFPAYYGGYFQTDLPPEPGPVPNVIVLVPVVQPSPETPTPPAPARPVMHEYQWPNQDSALSAAFSIVSSDGTVHYATMVWIERTTLRFTTPGGGAAQLPLASVSRAHTELANAEKNLKLPLP